MEISATPQRGIPSLVSLTSRGRLCVEIVLPLVFCVACSAADTPANPEQFVNSVPDGGVTLPDASAAEDSASTADGSALPEASSPPDSLPDASASPDASGQPTWRIVPSGTDDVYSVLAGATGQSVWLFGSDKNYDVEKTLRWDGSRFVPIDTMPVPPPNVAHAVPFAHAAWASAPTDMWISRGLGTLQHGNGTTWSNVQTHLGLGSGVTYLRSLWGSSSADVWMGGGPAENTIQHWNGQAWSTVPTDINDRRASIISLSGTSPTDAWAIASDPGASDSGYPEVGAIVHWDGVRWTSLIRDKILGRTMWASAKNDVWITTPSNPSVQFPLNDSMLHWNGSAFVPVSTGQKRQINALWGASPRDIWAVGDGGAILHWNGVAWSSTPSGTTKDITTILGASATDIWAAGSGGVILHYSL